MFGDSVQEDPFYRNRTATKILIAFVAILLLLVSRLYYLQILKYDYHLRLSEENRVRLKVIEAKRGHIFDRHGRVMALNRPSYQISLLPTELKDPEKVFRNLMRIVDTLDQPVFDSSRVRYMMERGRWKRFSALPIYEDASLELVSVIEEHQLDLQGVVTVVSARREYPYGPAAAHSIGYTAEINEEELDRYLERGYQMGNRIGVKGLEKYYESEFRGRDGKQFVEVNAYGKELGMIEEMPNLPAEPGKNLHTTLDMELQLAAEGAFPDSLKGAVVAIDPRNGEVLVMLSSPRIDGNIFSLSKKKKAVEWQRVALDSRRPLNNRAVIGLYEPASTFKTVVSMAAFHENKVTPSYREFKSCVGGFQFGNLFKRCWLPRGHGSVDFFEAYRQSCDVYYYQLGLLLGMAPINAMAYQLGFGQPTGIDLSGEYSGLLVDSAVYNQRFAHYGWRWTRGQILNLVIGQGQLATPIQLANMAAAVGNGKFLYRPRLMKKIESQEGRTVREGTPEVLEAIDISEEVHANIMEAMRQVVNDPGGTGGRARLASVTVGGKTGSAENPHGDLTHALFIAIAPLEAPTIAIAVIVENAGHGGSVAAPIAAQVLKKYFGEEPRG